MKAIYTTMLVMYAHVLLAQLTPTPTAELDEKGVNVVKVEIKNYQYHVVYFDSSGQLKEWVRNLAPDYIYTNKRWKYLNFSVMTIPFKVRPAIEGLKQFAKADLKNAGVNTGVATKIWKRYLHDGTINEYKLSYGFLVAPSAEEFNSLNTSGVITSPTTQMVLSTGLTITGTYRGVNFAVIPIGTDFGLTSDSKSWKYNRKPWFGFGLGLDSKLIGF